MDTKIAVVALIIENSDAAESVNSILHDFCDYVVGRLGVPYRQKQICVISVIIDAPQETINSLSGKLGMIKGVSCKVLTTK